MKQPRVPSSREWTYAFCFYVCVVIFWGELFAWLDFCLGSLLVDAGWIFLVHVVHF
jgi:hypothetical protein